MGRRRVGVASLLAAPMLAAWTGAAVAQTPNDDPTPFSEVELVSEVASTPGIVIDAVRRAARPAGLG